MKQTLSQSSFSSCGFRLSHFRRASSPSSSCGCRRIRCHHASSPSYRRHSRPSPSSLAAWAYYWCRSARPHPLSDLVQLEVSIGGFSSPA